MITSNVNFNLYKSFIAAYENKNISKAAAALQITQPTVTYNIKELERQLGVKLFHTHPRGVEPTKDAHELYKFVSEGMTSISNGENAIKEFNEDSVTTIRITTDFSFPGTCLAKPIHAFSCCYPKINFEISACGEVDPVSRLVQHNTDVVARIGNTDIPSIGAVKIAEYKHMAIASKEFVAKHGLGETLTKKDLSKLPVIMFGSARKEQEIVKPFITVSGARVMMALVKQGVGIGILSEEHKEDLVMDGVVTMDISSVDIPNHVVNVMFNKESAGKATQAFIQCVKDSITPA